MLESFKGVEIGTRLKLRDDLVGEWTYDHVICTQDMARHRGEIVFVTEFISGNFNPLYNGNVYVGASPDIDTTLKRNGWKWIWTPRMFECIVEGKIQDVSLLDMLKEECV